MNSIKSLCNLCFVRQQQRLFMRAQVSLLVRCSTRSISFGGLFGRKKPKAKDDEVEKQYKSLKEFEDEDKEVLSEEEVMRMRDVSRLPPLVRSEQTLTNIPQIQRWGELKTERIRERYATYGRASGLKPGVMWPSREELKWLKGYEQAFCKPFQQLVSEAKAQREAEAKVRRERERDVMEKLKELPKLNKEFWKKYHEMQDSKREELAKKERLVQEVREFVGYDLDPDDPRFEEALIKKDEVLKRDMKAKAKQEKHRVMLERLQTLANEAMEREKQEKEMLEKSKELTKDSKSKDKSSADGDKVDNKEPK